MVATLILRNAKVPNVSSFSVLRGERFAIELRGIYSAVTWSATQDQVLRIKENGGYRATFRALRKGESMLTITSRGDRRGIKITVFEEEAVGFKLQIEGPEVLK